MTAYENLYYIGRIYGIPKSILKENIPVLLDKVGLDNNKKLVENFSTGMKKKLMIARAIIHDPDVIIADELLNGLDQETVEVVENLLAELHKRNKTIIIISHISGKFPKDCDYYLVKNKTVIKKDKG